MNARVFISFAMLMTAFAVQAQVKSKDFDAGPVKFVERTFDGAFVGYPGDVIVRLTKLEGGGLLYEIEKQDPRAVDVNRAMCEKVGATPRSTGSTVIFGENSIPMLCDGRPRGGAKADIKDQRLAMTRPQRSPSCQATILIDGPGVVGAGENFMWGLDVYLWADSGGGFASWSGVVAGAGCSLGGADSFGSWYEIATYQYGACNIQRPGGYSIDASASIQSCSDYASDGVSVF